MKTSHSISKRKQIQDMLNGDRHSQAFEAAARFQAMKLGAKWIDTYPKLQQTDG